MPPLVVLLLPRAPGAAWLCSLLVARLVASLVLPWLVFGAVPLSLLFLAPSLLLPGSLFGLVAVPRFPCAPVWLCALALASLVLVPPFSSWRRLPRAVPLVLLLLLWLLVCPCSCSAVVSAPPPWRPWPVVLVPGAARPFSASLVLPGARLVFSSLSFSPLVFFLVPGAAFLRGALVHRLSAPLLAPV
jgi:hypothetical protein